MYCTYIQHEVGVGVDEPHYAKQEKLVAQCFIRSLVTKHETHHLVPLCQTLITTSTSATAAASTKHLKV